MTRLRLAALAAMPALAAAAGLGSGRDTNRPPDAVSDSRAAYARRGTLGANDYVATNVFASPPYYALHAVTNGALLERAVNSATVADAAEFALPPGRLAPGHSRGLLLCLAVEAPSRVAVRVTGASRLFTTDGSSALAAEPGLNILSFVEIVDGVYMVEARPLTEVER